MSIWLLVCGAVLLLGSMAGFIRLQFSIPDRRFTLIGSIGMMIAALLALVLAIWVGSSEQLPYSVDGLGLQAPHLDYPHS